jgi:hypothetical protein
MNRSRMRRAGAAIIIAAVGTLGTVAAAGPAAGSPVPEAQVFLKPAGSAYYTLPETVIEGVAAGSSTTFQAELVNVGTISAQFNLALEGPFTSEDLAPATFSMSANGTVVPSDGWITPVIAPGASQKFAIKVTVPRLVFASGEYGFGIDNNAVGQGGSHEDFFGVDVAQSSGSSPADVFLKTGSQPFVGGWDTGTDPQFNGDVPFETLAVQRPGTTTSATIRLQNDGTTRAPITLLADDLCFASSDSARSTWPATVMDGFRNVTAAVFAGTYTTPALAPNAHRDLRLTVKNNSNQSCIAAQIYLTASAQGQSMVTAAIATAAL